MGDFFAFRRMLTLPLIRIIYVIGIVAITWVIVAQASEIARTQSIVRMGPMGPMFPAVQPSSSPWPSALLTLAVAQIVWRLTCEGVVVIFSIYESLRRIEERE